MTEVLTVLHPGHRVPPKVQETRLKGHWLQDDDDDADSLEFDKLLAELQSFPEKHNAKDLYHNGFSDDAGVKGCDGTETRTHYLNPSELGLRLKQLNDSSKERKQLGSYVKNMPVLESAGTHTNIQHSRSFNHDSQQLQRNVPSVEKIEKEVEESKNSKCDSGHKNKLQADIINTIQSKSQTPSISSSLVNKAHSKPVVVFANTAPAATLSLAELARQHKSQRARVAGLESDNEKLNKQSAGSTPLVLGCSTSAGSLTELPASYPKREAATASGVSLSQLALQHRHSKSPLPTVSPGNGYVNGYKPSLLQLMKNVTIDDSRASTAAAEATWAKVPKEPSSSLSLTLCLKVNKPSETSTKLPYSQQKQETQDLAVGDTFIPMDSQSVESDADSQEQGIPTDLIPQVSSVGFVLCCLKRKRKLEDSSASIRKTLKYPKFKCVSQVGQGILYPEIVYRRIEPFDFSTPSPDDLVRHKQKQAFTRPQKEFEF